MTNISLLPIPTTRFLSSGLPKKNIVLPEHKKPKTPWSSIIVDHGTDGVTVQDNTGRIIFMNKKAAEMYGIYDMREFLKAKNQQLIERFSLFDEFENPFSPTELPSKQVLEGKDFAEAVICFRSKDSGKDRWSLVRSVPWVDADEKRYILNTFVDITEYKQRESDRAIQLGVVSHDVKSLLTSVKAYEQLLERKLMKQNDVNNMLYVQKMDIQLNKLSQFISDMMDTSRIQARKLALHKEMFDITTLVADMIEDFKITYPEYTFKIDAQSPLNIFADRHRIMQVFLNLLTNAVKYSPKGTMITVTLLKKSDKLICSVADEGIGILQEHQKRIFELYYQVEKNNSLKKGLGIGLYIAEGIIKTHGGTISVASRKEKGTIFSFSLPLPKITHA